MRFEVTGGNGRGAKVSEIQDALRHAGAARVGSAHAFGLSNQPRVATFSAESDDVAHAICQRACGILWPCDTSVLANLLAYKR